MKSSGKFGLYVAVLCILALVAAIWIAAAFPGAATLGIAADGNKTGASQEQQWNMPDLPPNTAIAACRGKISRDACQFMDREGIVSGTCDDKPGVLACAPVRTGPGGLASEAKTHLLNTTTLLVPQTLDSGSGTFFLTSEAGSDGGTLPDEYSCDGAGASPSLSWAGAPAGTNEYALMMTTIPVDGITRWNWVLYHIPATANGIALNGSSIGILGTGSHGTVMKYDPPCSQGPGSKLYTFTLYALSASPELPEDPEKVTGPVLTEAISSITLAKATLNLTHTRDGQG